MRAGQRTKSITVEQPSSQRRSNMRLDFFLVERTNTNHQCTTIQSINTLTQLCTPSMHIHYIHRSGVTKMIKLEQKAREHIKINRIVNAKAGKLSEPLPISPHRPLCNTFTFVTISLIHSIHCHSTNDYYHLPKSLPNHQSNHRNNRLRGVSVSECHHCHHCLCWYSVDRARTAISFIHH